MSTRTKSRELTSEVAISIIVLRSFIVLSAIIENWSILRERHHLSL